MCVSVSVLWKDEGPRPGAGLGSRRHFETGCAGGAERRDPYADGGEFCLQAVKGLLFGRLPSPGLASQRLASPDQDLPAGTPVPLPVQWQVLPACQAETGESGAKNAPPDPWDGRGFH